MKVLLLEDDFSLQNIIREYLEATGWQVICCSRADEVAGILFSPDQDADLALVDRMLPDQDGLSLVARLRSKKIILPVIILTGLNEIDDRISGFDAGADDYLAKPFHLRELSARMNALLRRAGINPEQTILTFSDLSLDLKKRQLRCNGNTVKITEKEARLLEAFLRRPDQVLSREYLINRGWSVSNETAPGSLDTYISFLRKRLQTLKSRTEIRTLYQKGYMLVDQYD